MAQAIGDGIPKLRIEEAAAHPGPHRLRAAAGDRVNKYQVDEDQDIEVLKVENSRVRAEQLAKLKQLRAERDEAAVTAALDELARPRRRGAGGQERRPGMNPGDDGLGNNLLALAIDAARPRPPSVRSPTPWNGSTAGIRPRSEPSPGSTATRWGRPRT